MSGRLRLSGIISVALSICAGSDRFDRRRAGRRAGSLCPDRKGLEAFWRSAQCECISLLCYTKCRLYSILRRRKRGEALHDAICTDLETAQDRRTSSTIISIRDAFSDLSVEQREVIVLKILHQMTFKEIAETVGVSANTTYARYRFGIEKIRQVLDIAE